MCVGERTCVNVICSFSRQIKSLPHILPNVFLSHPQSRNVVLQLSSKPQLRRSCLGSTTITRGVRLQWNGSGCHVRQYHLQLRLHFTDSVWRRNGQTGQCVGRFWSRVKAQTTKLKHKIIKSITTTTSSRRRRRRRV